MTTEMKEIKQVILIDRLRAWCKFSPKRSLIWGERTYADPFTGVQLPYSQARTQFDLLSFEEAADRLMRRCNRLEYWLGYAHTGSETTRLEYVRTLEALDRVLMSIQVLQEWGSPITSQSALVYIEIVELHRHTIKMRLAELTHRPTQDAT